MELNHGWGWSHFSTSQNGAFSFQWKIHNISYLQQDFPISSPEFCYKGIKYPWILELKTSFGCPYNFLLLKLCKVSNDDDEIDINFTITVFEDLGPPFYTNGGSVSHFSKLNPVKLLPNIHLPISLCEFINISCTIQVTGPEVESRTKTGTYIYPNLESSESQSNQQSSANEMDNNSGNTDRTKQGANSLLKEKKVDESYLKIADSVPERTSGAENTPDDSPDLETLKQLSIDLKRMLTQTMNADVTIRVEDITIKAHKNILCARSQVFCSMFEHSTIEAANNEIEVTDIRASVMKKLINYLYCGEKGRLQYEDACDLYYAADKYEVLGLRLACMKDLLSLLDVNNACPMLSLAYRHSDEVFKEQIMNFISKNFISIVKTESWIELTDKDTKLAALLMRYCAESLTK